jgi:hypothetical protein
MKTDKKELLTENDYDIYTETIQEIVEEVFDAEFENYFLGQTDEAKEALEDIANSKLKATSVILNDYGEYYGYFEDYDYYNFNGSHFFVVDKINKLALELVEPREYDTLKELIKDRMTFRPVDNETKEAYNKYNPELIIDSAA